MFALLHMHSLPFLLAMPSFACDKMHSCKKKNLKFSTTHHSTLCFLCLLILLIINTPQWPRTGLSSWKNGWSARLRMVKSIHYHIRVHTRLLACWWPGMAQKVALYTRDSTTTDRLSLLFCVQLCCTCVFHFPLFLNLFCVFTKYFTSSTTLLRIFSMKTPTSPNFYFFLSLFFFVMAASARQLAFETMASVCVCVLNTPLRSHTRLTTPQVLYTVSQELFTQTHWYWYFVVICVASECFQRVFMAFFFKAK